MTAGARLLTVSNFFDSHRGGLDIVAGHVARELAARGFNVTWLATDFTPEPEGAAAGGVRSLSVRCWNVTERRLGLPWPVLTPRAVATLWAAVEGADAVLLHDSLYMTSIVTCLAARRWRKPLVIIQHIGAIPYRNPLVRGLMAAANLLITRPVLSGADQVVFISGFVRDYFSGLRFRAVPRLIFNGVDTAIFRPACNGEKDASRAKLKLDPTATVALFVGRFVEKKGVEHLRRAAGLRPNITFAFAGWGPIDPGRWGLPNVRVFSDLAGASLADLYRASDVFVLPSQGEGFPLVVQEALACGLPVVCGGECLDADPEATGFLAGIDVAGDDAAVAQRVAAAMDCALAKESPAEAAHRAAFVQTRYSWSAAADAYAGLFAELLQAKRAAVAGDARQAVGQAG